MPKAARRSLVGRTEGKSLKKNGDNEVNLMVRLLTQMARTSENFEVLESLSSIANVGQYNRFLEELELMMVGLSGKTKCFAEVPDSLFATSART